MKKLVITGPTGVGKTEYVNDLIERLPVEVINLDSIQVYAFFRVGPGRDDAEHGARRHLYGYLSPLDVFDVASYLRSAAALIHEIEHAGRIPVFEGGSRSLLCALCEAMPLKIFGIRPPEDAAVRRARLRQRVEHYFKDDLLVREVQEGIRLGYGDCKLMRDPLVYMQTRDYLAGRMTLEECKSAMVDSMLEMQDDQMAVFSRQNITWVTAGRDEPAKLTGMIDEWLNGTQGPSRLAGQGGRSASA